MKNKYFVVSILMTMLACQGATPKEEAAMRLATYQVPQGYQERIAGIMNNSFKRVGDGTQAVASVSVLPNGLLAVLGSDEVHQGFAQIVKDLQTLTLPQKENGYLDLWIVKGVAGSGQRGPRLAPISAALDEVDGGAQVDFQLLDKLGVSGIVGERLRAKSRFFDLRCYFNRDGDKLLVSLGLEGDQTKLDTQIALQPDQFLVIGESSARDRDDQGEGYTYNLFYILHTRIE